MKSIKIQNLRSIKNTEVIPINALTVLLGQNSSGKSTFLRLFPLLKQSIEARTRGPILWFGDYVDFGDFDIAVRKGEKEITFQFELDIPAKIFEFSGFNPVYFVDNTTFILLFSIKSIGSEKTYINKLSITFFDQKTEMSFNSKGKITNFSVNEDNFTHIVKNMVGTFPKGIIPYLSTPLKEPNSVKNEISFQSELNKFLKSILGVDTNNKVVDDIIKNTKIGSNNKFLEELISDSVEYSKIWMDTVKNWDIHHSAFIKYRNLVIALNINSILELLDDYLMATIRSFHYIKPIRATAERSYRKQDLAVTSVDPHGNNLSMFIENLSTTKKEAFQNWTSKAFGFYPNTRRKGLNIELLLTDTKTGSNFNLADRGFGFSQILPIITQLWTILEDEDIYQKIYNVPITFAIEQPELHLHPALQAQLIDCFIETIKYAREKGIELKLILETHSQTLVNRIGHRIANKNLSENDVSIALFEFVEENNSTVVLSKYNKQGFLENWPIGFFEPTEI